MQKNEAHANPGAAECVGSALLFRNVDQIRRLRPRKQCDTDGPLHITPEWRALRPALEIYGCARCRLHITPEWRATAPPADFLDLGDELLAHHARMEGDCAV